MDNFRDDKFSTNGNRMVGNEQQNNVRQSNLFSRFTQEGMERELENVRQNNPEHYEEAKKEVEEIQAKMNSEEFRSSMAGIANFFAGLAGMTLAPSQNDNLKEQVERVTNPFVEDTSDILIDPQVMSFLFSLDGVGYDDSNIHDIHDIPDVIPPKKQWQNNTSPFLSNFTFYDDFMVPFLKLDKETEEFYKK